jgi:hypothetical protein
MFLAALRVIDRRGHSRGRRLFVHALATLTLLDQRLALPNYGFSGGLGVGTDDSFFFRWPRRYCRKASFTELFSQ